MKSVFLLGALLVLLAVSADSKVPDDDCEVCIAAIKEFYEPIKGKLVDDLKKNQQIIETEFKKFCKNVPTKSKIKSFCYYLGGLEESATGILGEMSKPLSYHKPTEKICNDLKKKVGQICDLRFEKQIDLNTVDLKKLKVKDLKKVLNDWDELCEGCIEKADFIKRIEELKPKYMRKTEL